MVTAGRQDVINLLQNTPFVFGMLSGDPQAQLQEVADLTGGQVFDLGVDSQGFAEAVVEAVDTTQPPPDLTRLALLDRLTIERAEINWQLDDQPDLALVRLDGRVTLPTGFDFANLAPSGAVIVYIADADAVDEHVTFDVSFPRPIRSLWKSTTKFSQGLDLHIRWDSPTSGTYRLMGSFRPADLAIDGQSEPVQLAFVLSLGEEMLSKDVPVLATEWDRSDTQHWRKR